MKKFKNAKFYNKKWIFFKIFDNVFFKKNQILVPANCPICLQYGPKRIESGKRNFENNRVHFR